MVRGVETKNKRRIGNEGEKIAKDYLEKNNYEILAMNYRVGRNGEIDIVARESGYVCFIEVKARKNTLFGRPCEAVNKKKQNKIIYLAYTYIKEKRLNGCNIRFDIVEILMNKQNGDQINLIKNAFGM